MARRLREPRPCRASPARRRASAPPWRPSSSALCPGTSGRRRGTLARLRRRRARSRPPVRSVSATSRPPSRRSPRRSVGPTSPGAEARRRRMGAPRPPSRRPLDSGTSAPRAHPRAAPLRPTGRQSLPPGPAALRRSPPDPRVLSGFQHDRTPVAGPLGARRVGASYHERPNPSDPRLHLLRPAGRRVPGLCDQGGLSLRPRCRGCTARRCSA